MCCSPRRVEADFIVSARVSTQRHARAEPVAGFIVAARISPDSARALGTTEK